MPGIPKQAIQQDKEAEEAFLQQKAEDGGQEAVVEPAGPQPTHPETEPKVEKPAPEEAKAEEPADLHSKIEQLTAKTEKTEQLRSTYEGRHKKEIEDLRKALEERDEAIARMKQEAAANKLSNTIPDVKAEFTDEEREELGDEYIDAMIRVNSAQLRHQEELHRQEMEQLRKELGQSSAEVFWTSVSEGLGLSEDQLQRLDQSEEFNNWLKQPDGFSGLTLGDSLGEACDSRSSARARQIYQTFIHDKLGGDSQQRSSKPAVTPEPTAASTGVEALTYKGQSLDYAKVAELYSKGRISHEEMESLVKDLDKNLANMAV